MEKRLITTRTDNGFNYINDLTHPSIKAYAEKCGADFKRLDHITDCTHMEGKWHYRILKNYDWFDEYDRILHLDSDIFILKSCPNIFEEVPYNKIGSIYEDVGSRKEHRRECMRDIQNKFGDIGWKEGYPQASVLLTSKCHRDIFQKIDGKYYEVWGHDCVHLGYQINKYKFSIHELNFKWNHVVMFTEPWNNNAFRFDSYVVHYAGSGVFDEHLFREGDRISQINYDLHNYKDKILGY